MSLLLKSAPLFLLTLLPVAMLRSEVIVLRDPPVDLSLTLADWNDGRDDATRWQPRGSAARDSVSEGLVRVSGDGTLVIRRDFEPNRYPFIRFRAGGPVAAERMVSVVASPGSDANERTRALSLESGGAEVSLRLPPDLILTDESYDGRGLRFGIEDSPGALAFDYFMADAVPASALAEFDSSYPESFRVEGLGSGDWRVEEGTLRMRYRRDAALEFSGEFADDSAYDALELRIRISGTKGEKNAIDLHWTSPAGSGSHRLVLIADGAFHTYRLYGHKEPSWGSGPETLRIETAPVDSSDRAVLDIDYLRLYDVPNPGGGNISSGLLAFDENPEDWSETARLLDRWRFVAGQSYKGNLARAWQSLGRPFKTNGIRWETDHPTWQWLIDRNEWPRTPDGAPDLKAAARLAYDDLNAAARFLEARGGQLDAVHFDGLLKRLVMPWGHPHAPEPRSPAGGLFDYAKGNFGEAYRLAAETLCEFFALARNEKDSALTRTRFYIQPNFHVWAWRHGALDFKRIFTNLPDPGNFKEMMDALEAVDRDYIARGRYMPPSPLTGYGADWVFMQDQRLRLVSFEWYAREIYGREFNVVNNGTLKGDTPRERSRESLDYLLEFRAEGGRPSSYTPYYWQQTWRNAPGYGPDGSAVLTESEPHTVTWTLLQSARLALFMEAGSIK